MAEAVSSAATPRETAPSHDDTENPSVDRIMNDIVNAVESRAKALQQPNGDGAGSQQGAAKPRTPTPPPSSLPVHRLSVPYQFYKNSGRRKTPSYHLPAQHPARKVSNNVIQRAERLQEEFEQRLKRMAEEAHHSLSPLVRAKAKAAAHRSPSYYRDSSARSPRHSPATHTDDSDDNGSEAFPMAQPPARKPNSHIDAESRRLRRHMMRKLEREFHDDEDDEDGKGRGRHRRGQGKEREEEEEEGGEGGAHGGKHLDNLKAVEVDREMEARQFVKKMMKEQKMREKRRRAALMKETEMIRKQIESAEEAAARRARVEEQRKQDALKEKRRRLEEKRQQRKAYLARIGVGKKKKASVRSSDEEGSAASVSPKRQEPLYIRMEKEYERNVVLPEIAKEKRILAERQQSYRSPAQDSLRLQARQQALLDRYNDGASHHGSEEAPPSHRSASEQAASPRYYKSKWYKASAKELKENSPHKYSKPHRRPPPDSLSSRSHKSQRSSAFDLHTKPPRDAVISSEDDNGRKWAGENRPGRSYRPISSGSREPMPSELMDLPPIPLSTDGGGITSWELENEDDGLGNEMNMESPAEEMSTNRVSGKEAASRIGAVYKGHKTRKELKEMDAAASRVGAVYRGHRVRKQGNDAETAKSGDKQARPVKGKEGKRTEDPAASLDEKEAASRIGAVYKGHKTRKELKEMDAAASRVGAVYRGHRVRKQGNDAETSESGGKPKEQKKGKEKEGKRKDEVASGSLDEKEAASRIGAVYKGHKTRKELKEMDAAASRVGAVYRGHRVRKEGTGAEAPKSGGKQTRPVKGKEGKRKDEVASGYLDEKEAASRIGAVYKGHKTRKELKEMDAAASRVGAVYRGHRVRKQGNGAEAPKSGGEEKEGKRKDEVASGSLDEKEAASRIGAVYKGHKTRKELKEMDAAASRVGAVYRGHRVRKQGDGAETSESVGKPKEQKKGKEKEGKRKEDSSGYLDEKEAASRIGAVYKGHKTRKELKEMDAAASRVGAVYRGHRVRKQDSSAETAKPGEHAAASRRQQKGKEGKRKEEVASGSLDEKEAASRIGAVYKGHKTRKELKEMDAAASRVGAVYRGHRVRKQDSSAETAKPGGEGKEGKRKDEVASGSLDEKEAASRIGAVYKGHKTRKELKEMDAAASRVGAVYRGHRVRKQGDGDETPKSAKDAAAGGRQKKEDAASEPLDEKEAASRIGAVYKGHKTRKELKEMDAAASRVGAVYRGHRVRKQGNGAEASESGGKPKEQKKGKDEVASGSLDEKEAASRIGAVYKGHKTRKELKEMDAAASRVGAVYRGHRVRKQGDGDETPKSAKDAAAGGRQKKEDAASEPLDEKEAASRIGAVYKGHKTRKELKEMDAAASRVGAVYRGHRVRKQGNGAEASESGGKPKEQKKGKEGKRKEEVASEPPDEKEAASRIGAVYKGHKTRKELKEMDAAASRVGAVYRGHRVRKRSGQEG